jgi:hypothetical protein
MIRSVQARVGRDIFTDPEIFELEMKHIFRGQLDLSRPREPDPEQQRLLHHVSLSLSPAVGPAS